MRHARLAIIPLLLLCPAAVFAQQRPGAVTTFTLTDTTSDALHVGCAVGSSTCTGGIKAGPIDVSTIISAGAISIASNVPGVTTNKLYNNGGTLTWNGSAVAIGGAVGPGNSGKLAKFTGANSVGDSICTESGTTITCVNTVSATTLTGTLSTASQTAITGVGTITTGTWNATKIGLLYGGTNLDMTATGGTSQFLKQNSLGGAITVVRPAVADLSDAVSLLPFLASANTFTNAQTVTRTGGAELNLNFTTASSDAEIHFQENGVDKGYIQYIGSTFATSSRRNFLEFYAPSGIGFYPDGTNLRWAFNAAGDLTYGSSSAIFLSNGTPTKASGFGTGATVTGVDSSFVITTGSTANTGGQINFGHTFTNTPACVASIDIVSAISVQTVTTTSVTVSYASTSGGIVNVICHGK